MNSPIPQHFNHYYNLDDPRPYFCALHPADYRMPQVACDFLRQNAALFMDKRGSARVRVLDFACGFGINGLLLKHDLSLAEIYGAFKMPASGPLPDADRPIFAPARDRTSCFEVGGIDIADRALAYGLAVGALDAAFATNLLEQAPDPALTNYLGATDLILESGAAGVLLAPALEVLLNASRNPVKPWVLVSPRPDVDMSALWRLLEAQGYEWQSCNRRPIRYRRFASREEERIICQAMSELDRRPQDHLADGYMLVDLVLARPAEVVADLPIERLLIEGG